ncbi:mannitol-1-phosphate 5-dehydrogenase [Halobacillus salinus]|uniref:Mannitol-1-phosphate 5-dehydrogenase n=1 Tax=Halobacillus salinus TaxID=192814 RepID=A0A4Z0GU18_9BACI|nr:mannitol-1-phosphate 5-dehydrogenase [Halobacillus salinus]TGB01131.1 mannitol-1-phosphate 5-dehydrogenase [Halobacillus salinus]
MKALHFGAGNIGKGLIGYVLNQSGYRITFVDVDQRTIEQFNSQNSYTFEVLDENRTVETVSPVDAIHSRSEDEVLAAIQDADLITTSVGAGNLAKIAPALATGLLERAAADRPEIDVIANENMINASSALQKEIDQLLTESERDTIHSRTGFPNTAIDRLSLSEEGVTQVEPYYEWIIEEPAVLNRDLPRLEGATYVEDLEPFIERKLYIVNLGHAVTAYAASLQGYATIQSALKETQMEEFLRKALQEAAEYSIQFHGFGADEMNTFIDKTIKRFQNDNVRDPVFRVGRAPIRKLGHDERLIKPTRTLFERGLPVENLVTAIAAAFLFDNPEDDESVTLKAYISKYGINNAVTHFTGIEDPSLQKKIVDRYHNWNESHSLQPTNER